MDLFRLCQAAIIALALTAAHVPAAAQTAAAAPEQGAASSGWVEHHTSHFTALSNATERRTLDILRRLERFRQVLSILYPKMLVESPVETLVLVFRDRASMTPYAPRFEGRPVEIDGMFQAGRDANVILVNGSSQGDPLPIIYHEYMHFFTQLNFPPLPVWFNEGLAECYTTFRADEETAEIGRPIEDHVAFLRSSTLLPLKDLFAIQHGSTEYNEGERRGVFYAQSWAITHYLMWDNPDRRPQLARFLELLANGRAPEDAFTEAFSIDLETFQVEMKRHIDQNRFHHTIARYKEQAFDLQATTRALPDAEAAPRLAETIVCLDPQRAGMSRATLAPALAATPRSATAWRALGRIEAAEGARTEALQAYGRAFEADPKDAVSALLYGEALMAQGDAESTARGRDALGRALENRPGFTEAAIAYGRALLVSPESTTRAHLDRAIAALEPTGPRWSRGAASITLAYLYATRGDLDRAEAFVRSVLPHVATAAEVDAVRGFVRTLREQDTARKGAAPGATATEEPQVAAADPPPLPPDPAATDPRPPTGNSPAGAGPKVSAPDEEEIRRLQSLPPHALRDGDCISVFNETAALGNARRYKEALALVDRLLPGCAAYPEIKAQIVDLASRMRRDATRLGMPVK